MNTENYYKTRDLGESAALLVCKQHLVNIERVGKVCWFVFENPVLCKQISDNFFFGELMVNAKLYHEAITRLKNRMFARR